MQNASIIATSCCAEPANAETLLLPESRIQQDRERSQKQKVSTSERKRKTPRRKRESETVLSWAVVTALLILPLLFQHMVDLGLGNGRVGPVSLDESLDHLVFVPISEFLKGRDVTRIVRWMRR
jgi:hypothetical protein